MNTLEFAAERAGRLKAADAEMEPLVIAALERWKRGEADAWDDVIVGASVLWLEIFERHDGANPDSALDAFREMLGESLSKTSVEPGPPMRPQIDRVTMWLGTVTVNNATVAAMASGTLRTMRWVTMHDSAVREMHVVADGQVRRVGGTFTVGGQKLHYPGEPVGPAEVWINCRCLVAPGSVQRSMSMATTEFATEDVDTQPMDPIDLPDDPDEDAEIEDEVLVDDPTDDVPWHAVLAPEGVATGDGRMFAEGSLSTRELPLPITYQYETAEGHFKAVVVGRMDEAWLDEATGTYRGRGVFWMNEPMAHKAIDGIAGGFLRGLSVDVDDIEVEQNQIDENATAAEAVQTLLNPEVTVFTRARIAGASIVHIPAFAEAYIALGPDFEEDEGDVELTEEEASALAACGCLDGVEFGPDDDDEYGNIELGYDAFRDVPAEERKKRAADGTAMPDGSYPIANEEDLKNAIQAIGRAKDPEATKAHIKKRARALGHPELIPEGWALATGGIVAGGGQLVGEEGPEHIIPLSRPGATNDAMVAAAMDQLSKPFAPGTKDGPGWVTHPRATARIRRYWVMGKGAAKIRWGAPGDFNRCRKQLAKYVQNPEWLAGLCANMHKEALGFWPVQHRPRKGHALIASGEPAPMFTLVASGGPVLPSAAFKNPELAEPVGVVIDGDRIYGYVATWGVCHIGIPGKCEMAPKSPSNYAYFRTGVVPTDDGPVSVGQITMDTGHAPMDKRLRAAAAHYDNTGAVVADIVTGEDLIGIWFSGLIRPGVTEEQRHALAAAGRLSGDWRQSPDGNLELVAALAVNVPGFPIPRPALVASGEDVTSVVAMGIVEDAPAMVASGLLDAESIAAIVRTAVEEYADVQEKRAAHAAKMEVVNERRAQLRAVTLSRLRAKISE